jgi:hypothetical protein
MMTSALRERVEEALAAHFPDVAFEILDPAERPALLGLREEVVVWIDGPLLEEVDAAVPALSETGLARCRETRCERCDRRDIRSPCLQCLPVTDEELHLMPWRGVEYMRSKEELETWLASRKVAGRAIDIETCELGYWKADDCDPYHVRALIEPDYEWQQIGTNRFVRSPESRGWVWEGDLPTEKARAMYARIQREWEAHEAAQAVGLS